MYKSLLDSHCHLSLLKEDDFSIFSLYESLIDAGHLSYVWDIGIEAQDFSFRKALLERYSWVYFSIGLHPNAVSYSKINYDDWSLWVKEEKVILIGEMGLDFFRGEEYKNLQKQVFIEQIEFANSVKKPITLHIRNSEKESLEILKDYKPLYGGIWHCFSGNLEQAKEALDLGLKISFSGTLTYKNTENLSLTAKHLPKEALLIETDSPFLSPVPKRGRKNNSGYLFYTLERLAEIRKEDPQELAFQILENGKSFL